MWGIDGGFVDFRGGLWGWLSIFAGCRKHLSVLVRVDLVSFILTVAVY